MNSFIRMVLVASALSASAASLAPAALAASSTTPSLEEALKTALHDEYHAEAFYAAVIERFGNVRPFANIIRAERFHAAQVAALMKSHGFAVPANDLLGSAEIAAAVPASLPAACAIAVKAEIDNRDLYDKVLLPAVKAYPDVTDVFERLKAASERNHLPAFQRCAP